MVFWRSSKVLYYGDIDIPDEVKNKKVTLRAVTKLFNKHPVKQKNIVEKEKN